MFRLLLSILSISAIDLLFCAAQSLLRPQACTQPRTRVEFRELDESQRQAYLSAVACLRRYPSQLPFNGSRNFYDDLVAVHLTNVAKAHNVAAFLPWHRPFIAFFEVALNQFCGYQGTLPYWDWSYDSQQPERSPLFTNTYFGGNGDTANNSCLETGPFAGESAVYPWPHCLSRGFFFGDNNGTGDMMGAQYSPIEMEWVLRHTTFDAFRKALENHPHNMIHTALGGDMSGLVSSVNDPIFWLHHCNLDRWWARWQLAHPDVGNTYGGNVEAGSDDNDAALTDLMHYSGLYPDITVGSVMNFTNGLDGLLCYAYSNSIGNPNITNTELQTPITDDRVSELPERNTDEPARRRRHRFRRRSSSTTPTKSKSITPPPNDRTSPLLSAHTPLSASTIAAKNMSAAQVSRIRAQEAKVDVFLERVNAAGWRSYAAVGQWVPEPGSFAGFDDWKRRVDALLDALDLPPP
ncbi:hypothetical protein BDZ88DRAFT_454424 [Geranomyces variabilis]|nr:hypothetical protein BDZ88DRAFT_454424 [Geranomyces variabilis]KAJ3131971.1 hypothetical protein HDU90_007633 [Geranomyces variabilis]